jgi:hypothetical protein
MKEMRVTTPLGKDKVGVCGDVVRQLCCVRIYLYIGSLLLQAHAGPGAPMYGDEDVLRRIMEIKVIDLINCLRCAYPPIVHWLLALQAAKNKRDGDDNTHGDGKASIVSSSCYSSARDYDRVVCGSRAGAGR